MATVGRWTWGKTEQGCGWNLWEGCGLAMEKDGKTGYWGVYEADGSLLCQCVDYQSARKVVARFRRVELAQFNPDGYEDFAFLEDTADGLTLHAYSPMPTYQRGDGEHFPNLEAAEAFIKGREHIFKNGRRVYS